MSCPPGQFKKSIEKKGVKDSGFDKNRKGNELTVNPSD
jgi:hypothetical protein